MARVLKWCLAAGLVGSLALGCSDDTDDPSAGGTGGNSGAGGATVSACPDQDTTGCTMTLAPSADDTTALQTALIDVTSGGQVCLCPGSYSIEKELSLNVPQVTVRGVGAAIDDVTLDYTAQTDGDDGFTVTSDGFTIENLALKNTPGNGIVVTGAEDVTFRKLKVSWDAGSVTENGAYAVYPVKSKRVLVEDSEVIGAADAGIYVGQCEDAIVRNNKVHGNVAGIELENTDRGEVYGNEAWDNTAGVLVFVLPNLERKTGIGALVRDNHVHDNNRENFAEGGTIVAAVPPGTGMLVLGADEVEITKNKVENNNSTAVIVMSMKTVDTLLSTTPDPMTNGFAHAVHIHGNTFTDNGTAPDGFLSIWGVKPMETVVWDGYVDPAASGNAVCLGAAPLPTFRNLHGDEGGLLAIAKHTTDASAHECTLPAVPGVTLEQ